MKVPQTLADMLDNNAWKYPDETAFVWNDTASHPCAVSQPSQPVSPAHCGDWD